jgi:CTP synthase (UTP-ammonia lyase)
MDLGIELPYSLNIDNEGVLIIGCNSYKRKIGAKMFAIKYYVKNNVPFVALSLCFRIACVYPINHAILS